MGCSMVVHVGRVGAPMRGVARWPSTRMVGRRGAHGRGKARGYDVGPRGRPEVAGGVEVFTVESGRRRLQARRHRGLRTARVDGWWFADGNRRCEKEDAMLRQLMT
jgi:hypothetical protein